jgi:hypothetical protein
MNTSGRSDIIVESGSIVVLRLFDVAYAIDLARVEQLAAAPVSRIRLRHVEPKAMTFGVPPLELRVGPLPGGVAGVDMADAVARVYEFGVVSIAIRLPVSNLGWDEYVERINTAYLWARGESGIETFETLLNGVRRSIHDAMERPSEDHVEEDYLLASVWKFNQPIGGEELVQRVDLSPLMSGEEKLSASAREETIRHRLSYYENDLTVLTWDRAFILEPGGDSDVFDVLEVANAQLLELRYYDDLLDSELPRMYDRVEEAHRGFRGLARRRYAHLARQLHGLVAEVTEITERADNALKVTEDVYLARIYAEALELFRVKTWSAAVDRKLSIIRDTYAALYDDAATARAELLEFTIVLLIVFEVVFAIVVR